MQISAAVSRATGADLSLETLELSGPRDREILVRVVATGICHTDLGMRDSLTRVPKPIVLGHEGAGIVEKTGTGVTRVKPGDHIVMSFSSCGQCPSCYQGHAVHCRHLNSHNFSGQRPDGSTALHTPHGAVHSHFFGQSSFATYALCDERSAIPVRRDVDLDILGPLGCGIQTGAGAVINSLKVTAGSTIAVFGSGSVGLAAVMAARLVGAASIIAIDTQRARLDLAASLGATDTIDASDEDVFAQLCSIHAYGLDFALDTTGNIDIINQATAHLAPRGVFGLINTAKGASLSTNILDLVLGGRSILGIHQGDSVPEVFIPQLIDLYQQGRFPFDRLIRFYDLADINQAMADMQSGTTIKPVIRMPS